VPCCGGRGAIVDTARRYLAENEGITMETYTITRLEHWSDEFWETLIDAIDDTVVAVAMDAAEEN
jgi:hypothetical protein